MPRWPWSRRAQLVVETEKQPQSAQGRSPVAINPMDYSAKNLVLDVVRTERAKFYQIIDDPRNWESPTRSGHWEVRDLVGHMIDVTEGYLTRWDMARRGDTSATGIGLPVMAQELDRVALTFRNLPRDEAISRLKTASDKLMAIFDSLTADQWGTFNVTHVFMGPLPMFFYPAFQIMDYGVHTWDMRMGLGETSAKVDERAAGVLVPYMYILMQYTVDQESAKGVDITYGIVVDGDWGGKWRVKVKDGQFTSESVSDVSDLPAAFRFRDASEFVLTAFQRIEGGEATGDPSVIAKARHLYFRI
ncbi:MAG TPA: maleylpyruvate isomerase N-terminal domain-containing protein [Ktedonobacterales bacterium]